MEQAVKTGCGEPIKDRTSGRKKFPGTTIDMEMDHEQEHAEPSTP